MAKATQRTTTTQKKTTVKIKKKGSKRCPKCGKYM